MNKTVNNIIELGNKYGFVVKENGNVINLIALNTDNKEVKWINYNKDSDTVSYLGNTDNCNLWFCETRKDFTPEVCIQFVNDLNIALDLSDDDKFLLKNLIDPEDWQEIANVGDADEDIRYKVQ
jgi:hypothetical protein